MTDSTNSETSDDSKECELCGQPDIGLVGCGRCGRLMCGACEAAIPEDEATDDPICEECF